ECQFHTPSPAASRKTCANGSRINGASRRFSASRDDATPSAVAPTLSVISQLSLSVLATIKPSPPTVAPTQTRYPVTRPRCPPEGGGHRSPSCPRSPAPTHPSRAQAATPPHRCA